MEIKSPALSILNHMEWHIQRRVLHGIYRTRQDVPQEIYRLATLYEGLLPHGQGWNLPAIWIKSHSPMGSPLRALLGDAEYLIVYPKGDLQTKKHELLHAEYAMNPDYRAQVRSDWLSLTSSQQQRVHQVLLSLGYPNDPELLLDEFQAYAATERPSFFGIHKGKSQRNKTKRK